MGWVNDARGELAAGRAVQVRPTGGSMRGRIESGQRVTLAPAAPAEVRADDVVLVAWRGGFLLHLVKEVRGGRLLIGNNVGKINGWVDAVAVRDQEERFARVAARYRDAIRENDPAALALLERVCLFRLGIDATTIARIFTGTSKLTISGPALARLNQAELEAKLSLLCEMRLIEVDDGRYHGEAEELLEKNIAACVEYGKEEVIVAKCRLALQR